MPEEVPQDEDDFPTTDGGLAASTKRLAEWTFSLQGVGVDLKNLVAEIKEWVRTKMDHWSDRGPEDHEQSDREAMRDLIRKTVRATVEIGSYNEGGNGSSPQWRSWVMTMLGTLIVIGVTGLIVMYANQKAMETRMTSVEQRITNIEHKIWP
jgi:cytochrome b subunit of formate dehydrogenase